MRWARSLTRWLASSAAVLMTFSLGLALFRVQPVDPQSNIEQDKKISEPIPIFSNIEAAANEPVLVLQADDRGLQGWVAGRSTAVGVKVRFRAGGRNFEATVREDNTFSWEHTTDENLSVTASLALANGKRLTARTTVQPAKPWNWDEPTIFFITDRSAYRLGHTLKFAAFLRTLFPNGEFEPFRNFNNPVTIDLTSATKQTRATRLKLTADNFGRITGEYTFSEADALDHYILTAEGFSGDAKVLLGEYRKSKVGLKLTGEVKNGKLQATFDARDYLNRPVKGIAASYVATVSKTAEPEKLTLNPAAFAKTESGPPTADEFDALSDDERLLMLANGVSATTFAGFGSQVAGTREGTVSPSNDGGAKLELDLQPEWLKGNYAVTLSGVFTDETGRENRATATFKLDPTPTNGVRISTPRQLFVTGEKIPVTLTPYGLDGADKSTTSLVLVQLHEQAAFQLNRHLPGRDIDAEDLPASTRLPVLKATKNKKPASDGWKSFPIIDTVKREIHSLVPVTNNAAEIALKQPGAYKLLALTKLTDGTTIQSEAGVVVMALSRLPSLVLRLDRREIESGARLTGVVHTRFAGAKLLLTLRDSNGIKLMRSITTGANGIAKFDETLPPNLRYGCAVCVQYPESSDTMHADQRELFVIPSDRTIKVTSSVPPELGPGADVPLTVQVNRQEETDLIVSVFDESLLGVSGDLSKDIREYYLADTRGQPRAARELATTRLGSIAVADLVKKAAVLLEDKTALSREIYLEEQLKNLRSGFEKRTVTVADVVTLMRLTGLEVYLADQTFTSDSFGTKTWRLPRNATLADLLRRDGTEAEDRNVNVKMTISATVIGNVVLLAFANGSSDHLSRFPSDPWVYYRNNPYGYGFGCFGQFGMIGMGGQLGFQGQVYNFGSGFSGMGGRNQGFGVGGFGSLPQGFGGGFGGIGGGQLGFGGGFAGMGGNTIYTGVQGGFSHPGGQMGMSFGSNRDFVNSGVPGFPAAGLMPGLGLGQELVRRDFADSAFWSAKLRTDKTGKVTTTFKVPDSLTTWRVQVTAISSKMHVGSGTARFKTTRSIMIWPMLPRTFTEGDVVRVFGTVHNLSDKEQSINVRLTTENGQVLDEPERTVLVPSKGNVPVYWSFKAGTKGFTDLLMSARCAAGSDASLKKLPVTAADVLERATASGLVGKGQLKFVLPDDFDPARASATITIAPTLAADLADTLPYLVEYPYGCVEQTMSRFLPAIRVAQILRLSGISTIKDLEAKLPKVVEAGQKRLIELQQPDGGWGWQGNGATHELMTPYALYGLIQAEEISPITSNRIQGKIDRKQLYQPQAGNEIEPRFPCPNPRTIQAGMARLSEYLRGIRGECDKLLPFPPGEIAVPPNWQGGRSTALNDAIYSLSVYALKGDDREVEIWWTVIDHQVGTLYLSDYGHALALELAVKKGKKEIADKLVAELRKRAKKSGDLVYWTTAGFSRWGDNITEITAAVMKALVAYDPNDPLIPGILAFFHSNKRGDRWDSTKDTACVLYALCDYLAAVRVGPAATGLVKVNLNGKDDGSTLLDSPTSHVIKLNSKNLKPGENAITVTGPDTSGGALARAVVSFTRGRGTDIPAQDHGVNVTRTVSLRSADGKWSELKNGAAIPTGSYVKVRVTATPAPGTNFQYTLLESPKPAGGETVPVEDKRFPAAPDAGGHVLREDREAMTCFHYENAGGTIAAEYVVLTEFAGEFRIAPARVELMYKPTIGGHSSSFALNVNERKADKSGIQR